MSRNSTTVPRTFSMAFANSAYDESRWAAEVAQYTGALHHTELVDPTDQDVFSCLAEVFDEPFADTSAIPMWHLARLTRKHVTVALSGDGAGMTMSGYRRMIMGLLRPYGFKEVYTNEPNIALREENFFMARIGSRVSEEDRARFRNLRFGIVNR